jgi:hypothetical protein
MKRFLSVPLLVTALLAIGCTRSSRTAIDRWANDMREIDYAQDVDNRVSSYEWFYDMHQQIEAYKVQYELEKDPDIKSGVRNILNRQIAQYNANSQKYFKAMWKGRGLPDEIPFVH